VYGIKAAVRRLEFAPDIKEMEVKDITNGRFVFKPRPGKQVSLADLRKVISKAGYEIEGTRIEVTGNLTPDGLRVPETGQVFHLEGAERLRKLQEKAGAGQVTAAGSWKEENRQEAIVLEDPPAQEAHP
jgi:hypothetical protein